MDVRGNVTLVTAAPQQQQQQQLLLQQQEQSYPLNMISPSGRSMAVNGQRKTIVLAPTVPLQTHAVPMAIPNHMQVQYARPASQYLFKPKHAIRGGQGEPQTVRSQPYRLDGWRNSNHRDSAGIVKINDNGMCKIDMTRLINRKLLNQGDPGSQHIPPGPPPPMVMLRPAANLRPRRTVPTTVGDQQLLATAGISDPALQKVFVDLFAAAAAATRHGGQEQQTAVKFSIFRSVELMAQSSCRRLE